MSGRVGTPAVSAGTAGDASAANQITQIGLQQEIRDRLPLSAHAQPLTDAQLRAAAVPVSAVALGSQTDAAAAAAGTGDYSVLAAVKRGLLNWAALLGRLPASLGGKGAAAALPTVATPFEPVAGSTVSYSCSTTALAAVACTPGTVLRFGVAGSAAIGIRFGNSSAVSAAITAATAMDIMPGTAEAITVPADASHWSAIMSSGTGTLKVTLGAGS